MRLLVFGISALYYRVLPFKRRRYLFTELSTDNLEVAAKFVSDHLGENYVMVVSQRDQTGRFHVSINYSGPQNSDQAIS